MQRKRAQRPPVDGVLLLDKPLGLSSNTAMMAARRLLDAPKAGHGGTLDPLASGLLPVLFGEATKFAADLLDADKTYETTLRLGVRTSTGDAEGEVLARRPVSVDAATIHATCAAFTGEIEQVPPMHSALKRDGRPLYDYARAGLVVEREARRVRIHAIEVLDIALPGERDEAVEASLVLRVRCSKGTYIRTLAEDIGERLGCGAHLVALRRTAAGPLDLEGAVTLSALEGMDGAARRGALAPLDALLGSVPRLDLAADEAARVLQGQRLRVDPGRVLHPGMRVAGTHGWNGSTAGHPDEEGKNDDARTDAAGRSVVGDGHDARRVRLYADDRLLGLALLDGDGRLAPQRLIAQRTGASSDATALPATTNDSSDRNIP